jgi:hypothetical protein
MCVPNTTVSSLLLDDAVAGVAAERVDLRATVGFKKSNTRNEVCSKVYMSRRGR